MSPSFVETKEMTVGYRGVPLIRDIALRVHRGEIFDSSARTAQVNRPSSKSLIRQLALIGGTVYLDGKLLQTLPGVTLRARCPCCSPSMCGRS